MTLTQPLPSREVIARALERFPESKTTIVNVYWWWLGHEGPVTEANFESFLAAVIQHLPYEEYRSYRDTLLRQSKTAASREDPDMATKRQLGKNVGELEALNALLLDAVKSSTERVQEAHDLLERTIAQRDDAQRKFEEALAVGIEAAEQRDTAQRKFELVDELVAQLDRRLRAIADFISGATNPGYVMKRTTELDVADEDFVHFEPADEDDIEYNRQRLADVFGEEDDDA